MCTTHSLHRCYLCGALWFSTLAAVVVAALVCLAPDHAAAHAAGALDPYGCHSDHRKTRDYHCHRGRYSGIEFTSKADMLEKKKAGVTAEELRSGEYAEGEAAAGGEKKPKSTWSLLPRFGGDDDDDKASDQPSMHASNSGNGDTAIVPKGVEQRLRTLKSLHAEGLITDEEYERKKLEILGDL
jgi:hypothetical protein